MQTLTFHFKRGDWNLMLKPCFYFQCYCQSFNNSLDLSLQSVSVEEVITFFYSYYHKRTINFYNDSLHLLKKCPEKIYYHYYIIFSYKAVWSWDLTFIFACFEDCWMALNMFLRFFICQKMMKSINIYFGFKFFGENYVFSMILFICLLLINLLWYLMSSHSFFLLRQHTSTNIFFKLLFLHPFLEIVQKVFQLS